MVANTLVAGLLLCIVGSISAQYAIYNGKAYAGYERQVSTLKYKLQARKYWSIEPEGIKAIINVNLIALARPVDSRGSVLAIKLQNVYISVERDNATTVDLSECLSHLTSFGPIERTFLAYFDENGLLITVKVSPNETNLSSNIKLLVGQLLQKNDAQIRGQALPSIDRLEDTLAGSCWVNNEIQLNERGDTVLAKTADLTTCSGVESIDQEINGFRCLDNTCRNIGEKKLAVQANLKTLITPVDGRYVLLQSNITQSELYNPYKNQTVEARGFLSAILQLIRPNPNEKVNLIYENANVATNQKRLQRPSSDICDTDNLNSNRTDLRRLYSALTCEPAFTVLYQDIIARAINCSAE